jgi:hypothetical protein
MDSLSKILTQDSLSPQGAVPIKKLYNRAHRQKAMSIL